MFMSIKSNAITNNTIKRHLMNEDFSQNYKLLSMQEQRFIKDALEEGLIKPNLQLSNNYNMSSFFNTSTYNICEICDHYARMNGKTDICQNVLSKIDNEGYRNHLYVKEDLMDWATRHNARFSPAQIDVMAFAMKNCNRGFVIEMTEKELHDTLLEKANEYKNKIPQQYRMFDIEQLSQRKDMLLDICNSLQPQVKSVPKQMDTLTNSALYKNFSAYFNRSEFGYALEVAKDLLPESPPKLQKHLADTICLYHSELNNGLSLQDTIFSQSKGINGFVEDMQNQLKQSQSKYRELYSNAIISPDLNIRELGMKYSSLECDCRLSLDVCKITTQHIQQQKSSLNKMCEYAKNFTSNQKIESTVDSRQWVK